jgi:hypothetical protein
MEQVTGLEPATEVWKTPELPTTPHLRGILAQG